MSNSPTPAGMGTPFAPHLLVPVWVWPTTISLYPVVNLSMQPHERAHALNINKTALSAQNINLWLQLDALGMQLNLNMTVDGTINGWFCFFYDSWFDFSKLTILSFHNVSQPCGPPTGPRQQPCQLLQKNVKFVHVKLTIDYSTFANVNSAGPTILQAEYYIKSAHYIYPFDVPWSKQPLYSSSRSSTSPAPQHYLSGWTCQPSTSKIQSLISQN
jgi:hypothetical protein